MRCGAFGDIVLLTALIRQLHARFGQLVDVIASGPWTLPLLEGQVGVGEIRFARFRRLPRFLVPEQRELARWIASRGPGPAWFCDVKAGIDVLYAGGLTPDHIVDSRRIPFVRGEHFVDRWIRLANLTPPALEGQLPEATVRVPSTSFIDIDADKRIKLDSWLAARSLGDRPMIVLQIGSRRTLRRWMPRKKKSSDKYWPEERWVEVIHAVRERHPDHAILLLGAMKEFAMNERIKAAASTADVHNVADDLPIPTLLPLLERARGMISVDTGPAHAAAALGCPTVALFGDANPDLYRPGGPHTPAIALLGRSEDLGREGQLDIAGISVANVMDAWERLTSASKAPASGSD
jgi:heptosyltransferase-2/heptosyltransferase-3